MKEEERRDHVKCSDLWHMLNFLVDMFITNKVNLTTFNVLKIWNDTTSQYIAKSSNKKKKININNFVLFISCSCIHIYIHNKSFQIFHCQHVEDVTWELIQIKCHKKSASKLKMWISFHFFISSFDFLSLFDLFIWLSNECQKEKHKSNISFFFFAWNIFHHRFIFNFWSKNKKKTSFEFRGTRRVYSSTQNSFCVRFFSQTKFGCVASNKLARDKEEAIVTSLMQSEMNMPTSILLRNGHDRNNIDEHKIKIFFQKIQKEMWSKYICRRLR